MDIINRFLELVPHIFIVLVFFWGVIAYGLVVVKKLNPSLQNAKLIISSVLVGYVITSLYYFIVGMLGLYNFWFVFLIPFLAAGIIWFNEFAHFKQFFQNARNNYIYTFLFLGIIVLRAFPDIGFDSNWYHLSQPQYYLQAQKIIHVGGYMFTSGYPQFVEMLYIPLLTFGDSVTTSVFSLVNFVLLAIVAYLVTLEFVNSKKLAIVVAGATATSPIIFNYSNLAYVDIIQGLSLLSSLLLVLKDKTLKTALLAGILLTPAVTSKYSGILLCVPFIVWYLKNFKAALVTLTIPSILMLPWLIRNQLQVGYAIDPIGKTKMLHYGSDAASFAEYFSNVNWMDSIKILTTKEPRDILMMVVVVLGSILFVTQKKWFAVIFTILSIVVLRIMPPGDHYRYFTPFIAVIYMLFAKALADMKFKTAKFILLCIFTGLTFVQLGMTYNKILSSKAYAFGEKNLQAYKNEYFIKEPFIFYDTTDKYKNEIRDQKLIVKGVDLIFPTLKQFDTVDYSYANLNRVNIYSFKTLRQEMLNNDYKYILVNRGTLQEHFKIWFVENVNDKTTDYFTEIFHDGNGEGKEWYLYKTK